MKNLRKIWLSLTLVTIITLSPIMAVQPVAAKGGAPANAGRYIVVFNSQVGESEKDGLVAESGGEIDRSEGLFGNSNVAFLSPEGARAMARRAGVLRVEEDAMVYADGTPASQVTVQAAGQTLPWGVDRIDADLTWSVSKGTGIKVAVIDTGIDLRHPDLQANIRGGVNIIRPGRSAADDNGHGTHVAGTIAALNNGIGVIGVAPEAQLYAVKVLDRNGSGFLSNVIAGIKWAITNHMQVINMSLGTSSDIQSLHDAVDAAYAAGIVVVAAAGNSGGTSPADTVNYPARYSSVIAVAATDSTDVRPSWSSEGPEVELAAPGVNIYSTWPGGGYATISGTSMATPHVAGTAALVLKAQPGLTPSQVRALLKTTADDLGAPGFDNYYGNGLVDAQQAATGIQTLP